MRIERSNRVAKAIFAITLVFGLSALGACARTGTWVDQYGNIHGEAVD